MLNRSRRSCSAFAAMATYSSLRWLISITERPLPCQSSISAWARCSTAVGSAAGPAQKLWARLLTSTLSLFAVAGLRAFSGVGHRVFVVLAGFAFQHLKLVLIDSGRLLYPLQADQGLILGQLDQDYALGVTARTTDLVDTGTHQGALIGNQHDLLANLHLHGADQLAVALIDHHGDHALATTAAARIVGQRRALAIAAGGGGKDLCFARFGNQHGDDALISGQAHTAHASGDTAHGAHLAFLEANHLAGVGEHHHVLRAVGDGGSDQRVTLFQLQRNQAIGARLGELDQRGLLHGAVGGGHENVGTGRLVLAEVVVALLAFLRLDHFGNLLGDNVVIIVFFIGEACTHRLKVDLQHGSD